MRSVLGVGARVRATTARRSLLMQMWVRVQVRVRVRVRVQVRVRARGEGECECEGEGEGELPLSSRPLALLVQPMERSALYGAAVELPLPLPLLPL